MAQCKPAPLCSHLMPTGKLCRGVALRNERYCRSHIRNYRQLELDRTRNAALDQLVARVQCMDLPGLLADIRDRLLSLSRSHAILRLPELCYLLTIAIEELNPFRSNIEPEPAPVQIPEDLSQLTPNEFNQMLATITESNA